MGPWVEPVGIAFEPDPAALADRAYVWERSGRVWIVEAGHPLTPAFIDLSHEVGAWRDLGLLGFALHPNFRQNGFVYLAYTVDRHHLTRFGAPDYDPTANEYFAATIHRVTRYTARAEDDFRTIDPASRKVLVGETRADGIPSLHQSHGIGSLVFGSDGTLLVSCGDGASYASLDAGSAAETYFSQALAEGIIQPKENVGAFRAQLVDSLSGKILRLDPDTGDGLPSNPFFDPARPRSARSRVWALGLRNPFRMALRPNTGSHRPADGNPGVLLVGDLGWRSFEEINVVAQGGLNFGWPLFEGLEPHPSFSTMDVANLDAPNPEFGKDGCPQPFFSFRHLLVQDRRAHPQWPNPCDPAQPISADVFRFVQARPAIEWKHPQGPARTGVYAEDGSAAVSEIGAPGSPITGPQFGGTSSIGGTWYQGGEFPADYQNTYFHADYEGQWIRNFAFDADHRPIRARDFLFNGDGIVCLATDPAQGHLYYVTWTNGIKRIRFNSVNALPPQPAAVADRSYGASPLTVQFDARGSTDPRGLPLTYHWDFGDGTAPSTEAAPTHTFHASLGTPTPFRVTLSATNQSKAGAQTTLLISVNNTPPVVTILSPTNGTRYGLTNETTFPLIASVADAEHGAVELRCEWKTTLHHNAHAHTDPVDTHCVSELKVAPLGCAEETYYYTVTLTVTDAAGLAATSEVNLYPDCASLTPILLLREAATEDDLALELLAAAGYHYRIERSNNLRDWQFVSNVQPNEGVAVVRVSLEAGTGSLFYRAALSPEEPR